MQVVASVVLGVLVIVGSGWLLTGNDLALKRYFSPKYEQVRRETFEQSKAYRQGLVQQLTTMQFQYQVANEQQKQALRSVILHVAADVPADVLTPSLNSFIQSLKESF